MILCHDCKHFENRPEPHCRHEWISPVDGHAMSEGSRVCVVLRSREWACGSSANGFEPRDHIGDSTEMAKPRRMKGCDITYVECTIACDHRYIHDESKECANLLAHCPGTCQPIDAAPQEPEKPDCKHNERYSCYECPYKGMTRNCPPEPLEKWDERLVRKVDEFFATATDEEIKAKIEECRQKSEPQRPDPGEGKGMMKPLCEHGHPIGVLADQCRQCSEDRRRAEPVAQDDEDFGYDLLNEVAKTTGHSISIGKIFAAELGRVVRNRIALREK